MSTDVDRSLDAAIRGEQTKLRQLDDAIAARDVAEAEYVRSGSEADLDVVTRARLKAERARTLHEQALASLDAAKRAKRADEVEKIRDQHRLDLLALPHFAEVLDGLHERVIAIDRSLDSVGLEYVQSVFSAQLDYDAAAERAASIGATLGSIVRPTIGDAILGARIRATEARRAEGREDVSDFLSHEANEWRQSDMNAAERAANDRTAARNRADEATQRTARMTLAAIDTK